MKLLPLEELALAKPLDDKPLDEFVKTHVLEPKLDGFRVQVLISAEGVDVYTRTLHAATGKLLAVERAIEDVLPAFDGTILDGEAVYLDARGQADFNWTSRVMGSHAPVAVKKQKERDKHLSLVAFDIPWFLGSSIMNHSWQERRQILTAIIAEINSDFVSIIDYTDVSLSNHMTYTRKFGEGSMLKQVDAPYRPGRSKNWLKIKKILTEDVVITGYTKGAGKYQGMIGAITFGQYKNGELCERGKCSGMTDRERTIFSARFHRTPQEIIGHVMSITHNGLLGDGGFRHPQFERLRPTSDKKAEDCTWS